PLFPYTTLFRSDDRIQRWDVELEERGEQRLGPILGGQPEQQPLHQSEQQPEDEDRRADRCPDQQAGDDVAAKTCHGSARGSRARAARIFRRRFFLLALLGLFVAVAGGGGFIAALVARFGQVALLLLVGLEVRLVPAAALQTERRRRHQPLQGRLLALRAILQWLVRQLLQGVELMAAVPAAVFVDWHDYRFSRKTRAAAVVWASSGDFKSGDGRRPPHGPGGLSVGPCGEGRVRHRKRGVRHAFLKNGVRHPFFGHRRARAGLFLRKKGV